MTLVNDYAARTRGRRAAFALLAGGVLLFAGCREKEKPGAEAVSRPVVSGVEVMTVSSVPRETFAEAVGTVRARTIAAVAPQVMGRVTAVHASEGMRVAKGAPLVTIEDGVATAQVASAEGAVAEAEAAKADLEGAVVQAQANRTLAESTYERFRKLYEEKAVTRQEFDEAEARKTLAVEEHERAMGKRAQVAAKIAQAGAQAHAAKTMLSYTKVTAPFAGVVTEKKVEAGTMAVPGVPLLTLEDTSRYRIEAAVPEAFLPAPKAGAKAWVVLDSEPGRTRDATVSEVVPLVDPASRTFTVKAEMAGHGLRTGMYGRVRFSSGKRNVLAVPVKALSRAGGYDRLFVVTSDNVARLTMVRTGETMGDQVEVLSGLEPGSRVAVSPVEKLADGVRVEVR